MVKYSSLIFPSWIFIDMSYIYTTYILDPLSNTSTTHASEIFRYCRVHLSSLTRLVNTISIDFVIVLKKGSLSRLHSGHQNSSTFAHVDQETC